MTRKKKMVETQSEDNNINLQSVQESTTTIEDIANTDNVDVKSQNPHEDLIDQAPLAEQVEAKIPYVFREQFLVKPLEPIKIEKEFSTPVAKSDKPKKDKNGVAAVDYDEVKTEKKMVDAEYRLAVVLKLPYNYTRDRENDKYTPFNIEVGDVIFYYNRYAKEFDLIKDSALVNLYDIVGIMRTKPSESK